MPSRFLLLSISLFALLLAYPFWSRSALGLASFDIVFWTVILTAIYAISSRHWSFYAGLLLAVLALTTDFALYFNQHPTLLLVSCLLDLLFMLFVTGVVIGYVLRREQIDSEKILAAISGYILLGLCWALLYGALELSTPGSFRIFRETGLDAVAAHTAPHWADLDHFIYYSLVTLSTLGYGDIVAVTRAARAWSAVEAIVGQLYLAILLARLIGLHLHQLRTERLGPVKKTGTLDRYLISVNRP